jgi:hypothetical protein
VPRVACLLSNPCAIDATFPSGLIRLGFSGIHLDPLSEKNAPSWGENLKAALKMHISLACVLRIFMRWGEAKK